MYTIDLFFGMNRLIVCLCVALSVSACNSSTTAKFNPSSTTLSNAPLALKYTHSLASNDKNYMIFFAPVQLEALPVNRYFNLQVYVKSALQQALNFPVQLDFDAGMRAHNHGMNVKPNVENLGNGHFLIKGVLLHMSGQWTFKFTLHRGVLSEQAKITVRVTQ